MFDTLPQEAIGIRPNSTIDFNTCNLIDSVSLVSYSHTGEKYIDSLPSCKKFEAHQLSQDPSAACAAFASVSYTSAGLGVRPSIKVYLGRFICFEYMSQIVDIGPPGGHG